MAILKIKMFIFFFLFGYGHFFAYAQSGEVYSLQKCISLATSRNSTLKKKNLSIKIADISHEQAQMALFPSVSFQSVPSFNIGRSVDPYSNQFVNRQISSINMGVNASYTLYDHRQRADGIEQSLINHKLSIQDYLIAKNKLILDITQVYSQILFHEEAYESIDKQLQLLTYQAKNANEKVKNGILTENDLVNIQAQMALEKLNLMNTKNNILQGYHQLHQFMNLPNYFQFKADRQEHLSYVKTLEKKDSETVFNQIIRSLPQAIAADSRIKYADIALRIAKAARFPAVTLNVGFFSTYSSAAPKERLISNGGEKTIVELPSEKFILLNNKKQFVFEPIEIPNGYYQNLTFFNQLYYNSYANIGLTIRVPVFNASQVNSKVQIAEINKHISSIEALEVQNQFRQHIEELTFKLESSEEKYRYLTEKLKALQSTFLSASEKYNEGISNFQEFLTSKTNYDRGTLELLQAKYEIYFNQKVLSFYFNKFIN